MAESDGMTSFKGLGFSFALCVPAGSFGPRNIPMDDFFGTDQSESMPTGDFFGSDQSVKMPMHFFFGALRIDHTTAIRADITKQNYTVCPRHWYVDAFMPCQSCWETFLWSAAEQRLWFEEYHFFVDSQATRCRKCRALKRQITGLKQQYDQTVSEARTGRNVDKKKLLIAIIYQLACMIGDLPANMTETRKLLLSQIRNAEPSELSAHLKNPISEMEL